MSLIFSDPCKNEEFLEEFLLVSRVVLYLRDRSLKRASKADSLKKILLPTLLNDKTKEANITLQSRLDQVRALILRRCDNTI